eukprot:TRINITY_DN27050_c0_g1_i2.p1 TRINITY_DN27050_c0_g1~~TRINITY_DN27050_c0_g1_i2.p1  ORF type:complete len:491 (-),score=99.49 TRINITY_DN27050_c0_g1_i2:77-1549(-)
MLTTVLHPLNLTITSKVFSDLERARSLVDKHCCSDGTRDLDAQQDKKKEEGDIETLMIPNTPRALLDVIRARARSAAAAGPSLHAAAATHSRQSYNVSGPLRGDGERSREAADPIWRPQPASERGAFAPAAPTAQQQLSTQLLISCLAAHPEQPCLVAGIANGELAVYHLFRAHGERRPRLHQTLGFDGSGGKGDVATALYMPDTPLAQEGVLKHACFIVGFRSGRVAAFQTHAKGSELKRSKGFLTPAGADADDALFGYSAGVNYSHAGADGPALLAAEPLLLEHRHCQSPIAQVFWHASLGIVSITVDGGLLFAATNGSCIWSIKDAIGPRSRVVSADLSFERENIALAGQRIVSVWNGIAQTQVGTLDAFEVQRSPILLLRYLPSQMFFVTVHEGDGAVLIWDAVRLGLHRAVWSPPSWPPLPKVSCAAWFPQQDGASEHACSALAFGAHGLTQRRILESEATQETSKAAVDLKPRKTWTTRQRTFS